MSDERLAGEGKGLDRKRSSEERRDRRRDDDGSDDWRGIVDVTKTASEEHRDRQRYEDGSDDWRGTVDETKTAVTTRRATTLGTPTTNASGVARRRVELGAARARAWKN
jgi:hypothetical protein